jgi:hypothetical protein
MGLLGMSFFFPPACIVVTVVLYTTFVAMGFFSPAFSHYVDPHASGPGGIEYSHYLRTVTFFAVGSFSALFSLTLMCVR